MEQRIRDLLAEGDYLAVEIGRLSDTDDLYAQGGLTSFASVRLMLALEERFDVEFPETMLKRGTFGSVAAIRAALDELCGERV